LYHQSEKEKTMTEITIKKHLKPFLLSIAFLLAACTGNRQETIADTDRMLEEDPQQALTVLDSLERLDNLSNEEQIHLAWNRAVAHQALGMSLAEDELLPKAIAYYRTDTGKVADSYLLEASYLKWMGKETDALKAIDKGLAEIAEPTKKLPLLTAKAGIFERQREYKQAIATLKEALGDDLPKRTQAILNYKLGLNLSLTGDRQSERYYDESIRLATENGDTAMACEFLRNYADYLANSGQYHRSNDMYHRIGLMMPQVAGMSSIQMAMAGNYINLHRLDSARICNDKAIRSEAELEAQGYADIARRAVIEQERFLLDYTSGKPVSYVAFARYCDSLSVDVQMKENTSIRRLETKNRLQAANYELKYEKQRMGWLLSVAMLLLIGGGIAGYLYYRSRIQRLAEAEDRVDTLNRMLAEAQTETPHETAELQAVTDDDAFFKKILLQQLGIIRLVASTPTNQNQALLKRISGISGGEIPTDSLLVWSDLYPVIDRLYDDFHVRLKKQYGDSLTEKEVQICCLLCAGFSTKEIGVITQQSDATIYVRKTSIRKKIGAAEGQDIVALINNVKG
jgi:tetratricopeptide (TPR) repeat protein/DNA-binding CsgD family transcriptional regulator